MASPKLEFMDVKQIKWINIMEGVSKKGILQKKGSSGLKAWVPRFCALYYNYFLYFKIQKKNEEEPDKGASPKGIICLELADVDRIEQRKNEGPTIFVIPTGDHMNYFASEREKDTKLWVKELKEAVRALKSVGTRIPTEEALIKLKDCQKVFPSESSFTMPSIVPADGAQKFVSDMKKYREEFKRWLPFVEMLAHFAEFQSGKYKNYINWFIDKVKGVDGILNNSEEKVLAYWTSQVERCPDEVKKALESMFYREDLASTIQYCEDMLTMIQGYNLYKKNIHMDDKPYLQEHVPTIRGLIDKLKSFPTSQEVSMDGYGSGMMVCEEEEWRYDARTYTLKRTRHNDPLNEDIEWTCKGHHFQFSHELYGFLLWNNRSAVWTHPKCPFIIRYDYFDKKGVFKQYMPQFIKQGQILPPSVSDWQVSGRTMQAVTVGKREPPPEVPEINAWEVTGQMPPPVFLLVAMFGTFKIITRNILGLPLEPEPQSTLDQFDGLSPIY